MKRIYLDHAATTPLDPRVAKAMREFEREFFGNPSSTHREGQQARAAIDFARAQVAEFLRAKPQEIIFTSGATEANNLAIQGVINHALQTGTKKPHVITTMLEHHSVYNTVRGLQKRGVVEADFIKPDRGGKIDAKKIIAAVKPNTILVSVIFASNEIGTILPIREIGELLKTHPSPLTPVFHVDAVQAAKYLNCNAGKLNCDLLTISAHKLGGPKGIGALYVKTGLKMANLSFGGAQEYELRPGTQNTTGIIGLAKALEVLGSLEQRQTQAQKISKLRDQLVKGVLQIPGTKLNGPVGESRLADNANFVFEGVDQDSLMTALDLAGISASTGSACVSGSSEPSHVITALGVIRKNAIAATARFTLAQSTTGSEITYTINVLKKIIKQLRA